MDMIWEWFWFKEEGQYAIILKCSMQSLELPYIDKELYALVQDVKKWKHYLMEKKTIIHINHQPLQYLEVHSKLNKLNTTEWMGFLQKIHLIIKYKKGITNKLEYMLARTPITKITTLDTLMHMDPFTHDAYKDEYIEYENFNEVF